MVVKINTETCTSCGACVAVCPTDALSLEQGTGPCVVDAERCIECGACVTECPVEAITLPDE